MAVFNKGLRKLVIMPGLALVVLAAGCGGGEALKPTPTPTKAPPPAAATPAPPPAVALPAGDPAAGEKVFNNQGCVVCHVAKGKGGGSVPAPKLDEVYGSKVKLATGQEVVADAAYIRESIINPAAKMVAGYQPVMPAAYSALPKKDLDDLVAFIASLAKK